MDLTINIRGLEDIVNYPGEAEREDPFEDESDASEHDEMMKEVQI